MGHDAGNGSVHWPIPLSSVRAPTSTRREIAPARSSRASDRGVRAVLRMLMMSRMKTPDAAPDRKTMMPKTAMTESAEIIGSPLGCRCGPGWRAECFPCLLFHREYRWFPMHFQCIFSAGMVQQLCNFNAVRRSDQAAGGG